MQSISSSETLSQIAHETNKKMEINVSDKNETECLFFDEGFCRDKCRNCHPSEICENGHCKRENCPKRHPKASRYNQN